MADTMSRVDDSINNINDMMSDIGDKASGRIKDALDKYEKINNDFDEFIKEELRDIKDLPNFNGKTTDEKLLMLAQRYSSSPDRRAYLEKGFQDKQDAMNDLKKIAQDIISEQVSLINENNSLINELETDLNNDMQKKRDLEELIDDEKTNLKIVEEKIKKREDDIKVIEDEIKQLRDVKEKIDTKESEISSLSDEIRELQNADPVDTNAIKEKEDNINSLKSEIQTLKNTYPSYGSINKKEQEVNLLNKEKREFEDKKIELNSSIDTKNEKITRLDTDNRRDKIDELKTKNKELEDKFKDNYKTLNNNFKEFDLEKDEIDKDEQQQDNVDQERTENYRGTRHQSGVGGGATSAPTMQGNSSSEPVSQNNALTNLNNKELAQNIYQNYMNAESLDEKKEFLNGPNYRFLVNAGKDLKRSDRRKLYKSLKKTRKQFDTPNLHDFRHKYLEMFGEEKGKEWYYLLFDEKGKARNFRGMRNSLSVEELQKVKDAVDQINSKRAELNATNPELLKYFDDNFVQFVEINSLMERTGGRGPIKAVRDRFGGKKKNACDALSTQMKQYTDNRYNEGIESQRYANTWRQKLGQETVPIQEQNFGYSRTTQRTTDDRSR